MTGTKKPFGHLVALVSRCRHWFWWMGPGPEKTQVQKLPSLCIAEWFRLIQSLGFPSLSSLLSGYIIKKCFFWKDKGILRTHLFFFCIQDRAIFEIPEENSTFGSLKLFELISGQVNLKSLFFHVEFSAVDMYLPLLLAGKPVVTCLEDCEGQAFWLVEPGIQSCSLNYCLHCRTRLWTSTHYSRKMHWLRILWWQMEIHGWEFHRKEMAGKALKASFELCQKILRNRRERAKVNVTLLKSKLVFVLFCFDLR